MPSFLSWLRKRRVSPMIEPEVEVDAVVWSDADDWKGCSRYFPPLLDPQVVSLAFHHLQDSGHLFYRDHLDVCIALRFEPPDRSIAYLGHHRQETPHLDWETEPSFDVLYRATLEQGRFEVEALNSEWEGLPSISEERDAQDSLRCQAARVVWEHLMAENTFPTDCDLSVTIRRDEYSVRVSFGTLPRGFGADNFYILSREFSLLLVCGGY